MREPYPTAARWTAVPIPPHGEIANWPSQIRANCCRSCCKGGAAYLEGEEEESDDDSENDEAIDSNDQSEPSEDP